MIHPSAVIHPKAQVDSTVTIGPGAVIDEHVILGPHCAVGPHVYLTGHTTIGPHNRFHSGSVIGDAPQDLKYRDEPTRLRIGDHNVFREHCTVHRSNKTTEDTVIGSHCFFMNNSHVGHNSRVEDHVIMASGAVLGGHVVVEERAFISANCMIHQFVRVGSLSMMQGGTGLSNDLPPFLIARDINCLCGLNTVGLRRAGIQSAERLELRRLYHHLFRGHGILRERLEAARGQFRAEPSLRLIEFVAASRRGLCRDTSGRGKSEATSDDAT